ncbi:KilA-N domain-containing protein [Hirschia baltica]|uniref:KilA domain protein n=1 Tax=Hirschia baltica (strain ATCC 49814 / DSM 5838 / IFAM 1418) TaxID=582402 RepID=C6XNS3_HIRBI|nr:KilA-N domain-containing protein [Hirschia baltica]ACT58326.1 KilA domain protein [Hirschia baltica ATCC 49814]
MLFKRKKNLTVQDKNISMHDVEGEDYISLTDMVRGEEGADHIKNWMRNRNTVEFLGLWEAMNNPEFKGVEFDTFRKEAGLNSFTLTPKKWVDATKAVGILSKSGRNGGTYAHKDIAFEFGTWLSPAFKLYLIKEYQRLKEIENNDHNLEWNVKRTLSKTNYRLHTDAIKDYVLPSSKRFWNKNLEYAEEADFLNAAVFGCTAKEWRELNPERAKAKENVRDSASINELNVIANLESKNAEMIREGADKKTRFEALQKLAAWQLEALNNMDFKRSIKRTSEDVYLIDNKKGEQK